MADDDERIARGRGDRGDTRSTDTDNPVCGVTEQRGLYEYRWRWTVAQHRNRAVRVASSCPERRSPESEEDLCRHERERYLYEQRSRRQLAGEQYRTPGWLGV